MKIKIQFHLNNYSNMGRSAKSHNINKYKIFFLNNKVIGIICKQQTLCFYLKKIFFKMKNNYFLILNQYIKSFSSMFLIIKNRL